MTIVNLSFRVHDDGVEQMLMDLNSALGPIALAEFLNLRVDPYLRGRAKERFMQEGDDVTGPWAPLSKGTQEIRANLGYGPSHPINKRTGELENYIVGSDYAALATSAGAILRGPSSPPDNPELKKKMKTAQQGGKGTPARPVLGMNERDLGAVLGLLTMHVIGEVH